MTEVLRRGGAGADPARGGGGGCRPVGVLRGPSALGRPASSGAPTVMARNGEIVTGIGAVGGASAEGAGPWRERGRTGFRFRSSILPRFARRTRSLDAALPALYLLGVSSGDFEEGAVGAPGSEFFGPDAGSDRAFEGGTGSRNTSAGGAGTFRDAGMSMSGADGIYLQGPSGGRKAVRSGADRGDAGGPEGTSGLPDGVPGERPELAGAAAGP